MVLGVIVALSCHRRDLSERLKTPDHGRWLLNAPGWPLPNLDNYPTYQAIKQSAQGPFEEQDQQGDCRNRARYPLGFSILGDQSTDEQGEGQRLEIEKGQYVNIRKPHFNPRKGKKVAGSGLLVQHQMPNWQRRQGGWDDQPADEIQQTPHSCFPAEEESGEDAKPADKHSIAET